MSRIGLLFVVGALALASLMMVRFVQNQSGINAEKKAVSEMSAIELQKWREFTSPDFKVLVPALPQHATEKKDDPKTKASRQYEMYVSEKDNGSIFMISVITMLDHEQFDESAIKSIINDMQAAMPNSQIKELKDTFYKGQPAIDFSIENDQVNISGKGFIIGKKLYVLSSAAKNPDYNHSEHEFFINSFQLLLDSSADKSPKNPLEAK